MKQLKCQNCGAPLHGSKCEYCGSVFFDEVAQYIKAIEKAEADAQVKKTNAQAEADAKLIEAEAEAEANRKVASSLSEAILEKMYYEKWNGSLPQVYDGVDGNLIEIPLN